MIHKNKKNIHWVFGFVFFFPFGRERHGSKAVLDAQATFESLQKQKVCSTSSAGEGKAQTAAKVTVTTGNMLYMLSSTGWEEADNKGLTHLKCRSKLSQGFSLWRYLTAAISCLFHVSIDSNSGSCNSSCNLFSS